MYFNFLDISILTNYRLNFYYPDFIIKTSNEIYLDIEIDEPYSFDTKEVIHYFWTDGEMHMDDERNDFFQENGWIVIRFTESQIINQPLSCCYEIAKVLSDILFFVIPQNKVYPQLETQNFWTQEEGELMKTQEYRNTYLSLLARESQMDTK